MYFCAFGLLHCLIEVALVCVVEGDAGLDGAADAVHSDVRCAADAADAVVGVVDAVVANAAVDFVVAPNQPPRKKIRTEQHSRYHMPMDKGIFDAVI